MNIRFSKESLQVRPLTQLTFSSSQIYERYENLSREVLYIFEIKNLYLTLA